MNWFRTSVCVVSFLSGGICVAASQQTTVAKPTLEAASIKPCQSGGDSASRSGGWGLNTSPGQLEISCQTIAQIIGLAYEEFADPRPVNAPSYLDSDVVKQWVKGGPKWIYAERYTIVANTSGAPPPTAMQGPMLRGLLQRRLGLSVHQDQRHVPASALMVASGGSRLSPVDPGSCRPPDLNASAPAPSERPLCGLKFGVDGPNVTLKAIGETLDQIARALDLVVHRPVVDQTGIRGQFTFKIEFNQGDGIIRAPLMNNNQAPPGPGYYDPFVFYMVPGFPLRVVLAQQLGLRLAPLPGPQVLVVEHVERPSGDSNRPVAVR